MKLDTNLGALINDIVNSDNTATFVVAPSEYDKEGFLNDVAARFDIAYRFNAAVEDLRQFAVVLANKILSDDPTTLLRIKQILFCHSRYNGVDVAIRAVLDKLALEDKSVLLSFERLEKLPAGLSFEKCVYLIAHAPKNVKIVLSSDKYLKINLRELEPKCPLIVDQTNLQKCSDHCTPEMYLTALDMSDVALMGYLGEYGAFPETLLSLADDGAQERFRSLASNHGGYLSYCTHSCGAGCYVMKKELSEYLESKRGSLSKHLGSYASVPLKERMFETLATEFGNYDALNFASLTGDVGMVDAAVKRIIASDADLLNSMNYIAAHSEFDAECDPEKYPYAALYAAASAFKHAGKGGEAAAAADRLLAVFETKRDKRSYCCAEYLKTLYLFGKNEFGALKELFSELKNKLDDPEGRELFEIMQYISPESMRYSALSASEAEQALELANGDRHYWSLRLLENVENYYYSIGNYRKSMETAEKLKSIFPMYVIPLRIIAMSYFYGDLKRTKNLVEEALSFAINNNLFNDTHMLYSVKALMESFYGNEETALMYSDRAYGALTDDIGFERYFTVYVRCYLNCLFNRVSYAANLANLYLHEAQELAPKYSAMMLQIYSYAALKEGNRSRSYRAATQAIDAAENRSFVWLYSMGLATNCLLAKGEIRDVRSIVTNILRCGENYGMLMVLTDTAVFGPILREAEAGEIEPETVSKIKALIDAKQGGKGEQGVLHVTMFGDSAVSMNGKELQWKTRKSKDLFLHYMLAGEFGIDRNVIIDYMWKDYLYDSAINNLKTTNNIIRKTLAQNGVKFKLEYINSRYVLHMEEVNCDYYRFKALMEEFARSDSVSERVRIMRNVLRIYKGDLGSEMNYPDFVRERNSVRHDLIFGLIKLVRALIKEDERTDAREFLSALKIIDNTSAYESLAQEIEKQLE